MMDKHEADRALDAEEARQAAVVPIGDDYVHDHELDAWAAERHPLALPAEPQQPTALDSDGNRVLTAGQIVWCFASAKEGKSLAAVALCLQAAAHGGRVVYAAHERDLQVARRFQLKGITEADGIAVWAPGDDQDAAHRWMAAAPTSLVVLDPANECHFDSSGDDQARGKDYVRSWLRGEKTKRTVLVIDHAARKPEKGQKPGPIGSGTKMAFCDVAYHLTSVKTVLPTGREIADPLTLRHIGGNEDSDPRRITVTVGEDGQRPRVEAAAQPAHEEYAQLIRDGVSKREAADKVGGKRRTLDRRLDDAGET